MATIRISSAPPFADLDVNEVRQNSLSPTNANARTCSTHITVMMVGPSPPSADIVKKG